MCVHVRTIYIHFTMGMYNSLGRYEAKVNFSQIRILGSICMLIMCLETKFELNRSNFHLLGKAISEFRQLLQFGPPNSTGGPAKSPPCLNRQFYSKTYEANQVRNLKIYQMDQIRAKSDENCGF